MANKCKGLALAKADGSTTQVRGSWQFGGTESYVDHFECQFGYDNKKGKGVVWVWASVQNVATTSKAGGRYRTLYTTPSDLYASPVGFRVRAVSKKYKKNVLDTAATEKARKKDKNAANVYKKVDAYRFGGSDGKSEWTSLPSGERVANPRIAAQKAEAERARAEAEKKAADEKASAEERARAELEKARAEAERAQAEQAELIAKSLEPPSAAPSVSAALADAAQAAAKGLAVGEAVYVKGSVSSNEYAHCVIDLVCQAVGDGEQYESVAGVMSSRFEACAPMRAGYAYRFRGIGRNSASNMYGPWSEWTDFVYASPRAPKLAGVHAIGDDALRVSWSGQGLSGTGYELQWGTDAAFPGGSYQSVSVQGRSAAVQVVSVDLSKGHGWHVRVRAVQGDLASAWSQWPSAVLVGSTPQAPTTYATLAAYAAGDPVPLRWLHNCADGCEQSGAEVEVSVSGGGASSTRVIQVAGAASEASFDTSGMGDGATARWRARTKSVIGTWGAWSGYREFDVYTPPEVLVSATDGSGAAVSGLSPMTCLPLTVALMRGGGGGETVMFSAWATYDEDAEAAGPDGVARTYAAGTTFWSADAAAGDEGWDGSSFSSEIGATAGIARSCRFTLHAAAVTESGLRAEAELPVTVDMPGDSVGGMLTAEVVPGDWWSARIRPRLERVDEDGQLVPVLDELGRQTYYDGPDEDGEQSDPVFELVEGVTLAVWRADMDGSWTPVAAGLPNDGLTAVTDRYPNFGRSVYRVTATDPATGAVDYDDFPLDLESESVVIQWGESWAFEGDGETERYTGSYVALPIDIEVANDYELDAELVEFFGRSHPVVRFGTQKGVTGVWGCRLSYADDSEDLALLRRMAGTPATCHVREPSGVGYDALVRLSETVKRPYVEVSLRVFRVDGGEGAA